LKVLSIDARTGQIFWMRTAHDGQVFDNRHRRRTYASPDNLDDAEKIAEGNPFIASIRVYEIMANRPIPIQRR
jgi:hypothetical protein